MPYKDSTHGKATISLVGLQFWLKGRLEELKTKKKESKTLDKKKNYGARATSYKEIIGFIESHLGEEKDVILEEKV